MTLKKLKAGIISDANILIDYANSSPEILELISTHIEKLYVTSSVLKEVDQFSQKDIKKLGIEIIEPTLEQAIQVTQIRKERPSLSGQDSLCYIIAKDNNWTCLSNDKPLRNHCSENKVQCIWGLEIMLYLVSEKIISAQKAYKIAQIIQSQNKFITNQTLERFKNKLEL